MATRYTNANYVPIDLHESIKKKMRKIYKPRNEAKPCNFILTVLCNNNSYYFHFLSLRP